MIHTRKDSIKTRRLLLDAACVVFGEKGFKNARIADICKQAGVNIALVNYHFGNKQNLYRETWRHAHRKSLREHPPKTNNMVPSPEERLRTHIESILRRIQNGGYDFSIMYHEMSNPTGLLAEIMSKELTPLFLSVDNVIRELVGPGATETQVQFCHFSVMGQCFHLLMTRMNPPAKHNDKGPAVIEDIDGYIDHVWVFSLAGIEKIRDCFAGSSRNSDSKGDNV